MGRLLAAGAAEFLLMLRRVPETIRRAKRAQQHAFYVCVFSQAASIQGGASAEAKSSAIQLLGVACMTLAHSNLV